MIDPLFTDTHASPACSNSATMGGGKIGFKEKLVGEEAE
jgi:hypothetical protein